MLIGELVGLLMKGERFQSVGKSNGADIGGLVGELRLERRSMADISNAAECGVL